jgi:hypothetical protein
LGNRVAQARSAPGHDGASFLDSHYLFLSTPLPYHFHGQSDGFAASDA